MSVKVKGGRRGMNLAAMALLQSPNASPFDWWHTLVNGREFHCPLCNTSPLLRICDEISNFPKINVFHIKSTIFFTYISWFSLMFASHVPRKSKSKFICNTNFQTASRFMRTMMITASRVMHWLLGNVFGFWCTRAIRNNAKRKKPNERRHELEIWDSHLNNHMWYGEDGVLSSFFIFELTAAFFFNQR